MHNVLNNEPHLNRITEVEQAPGDDNVVVAAHEAGHNCASISHSLQTRVNLDIRNCFYRQHNMFVQSKRSRYKKHANNAFLTKYSSECQTHI